MKIDTPKKLPPETCKNCWAPEALCLCKQIRTKALNRKPVLILQHPQELKNPKGTARLISLTIENGRHRVGFSWRSLAQALGDESTFSRVRWAVLYVGTKTKSTFEKDEKIKVASYAGVPAKLEDIGGFILLDGNWKETKTIWWRNPWLSRLPIVQLNPKLPAKYKAIARSPRKNYLSTLESLVFLMRETKEKPEVIKALEQNFDKFLQRNTEKPASPAFDAP